MKAPLQLSPQTDISNGDLLSRTGENLQEVAFFVFWLAWLDNVYPFGKIIH